MNEKKKSRQTTNKEKFRLVDRICDTLSNEGVVQQLVSWLLMVKGVDSNVLQLLKCVPDTCVLRTTYKKEFKKKLS